MVKIHNLSGSPLGLDTNGQSYVLPNGSTDLSVPDGSAYTLTFNNTGAGGGPPPPPSTNNFTQYGTLTVWNDSWQFEPAEAPSFYFMEGMVLGVVVFGGAYIMRIVKNVARQSPEV